MDKESGVSVKTGVEILLNDGENGSIVGTTDYLLSYNQIFIIKVCTKTSLS